MPRQWLRSARKAIGLPASAEVGIIAKTIKPALRLVEDTSKASISALISFPGLRGLYQEDILDTEIYLGLREKINRYQYHPHELVAAYAGHGLGLDNSRNGSNNYDNTEDDFPVRATLLVEYTEVALLLHHAYMTKAIEIPKFSLILKMSYDMGGDRKPNEEDIREFVLRFLYDEYITRGLGKVPHSVTVIITGSGGIDDDDEKLQQAVITAVRALGSQIELFVGNTDYVAARGAAELVWRGKASNEVIEL